MPRTVTHPPLSARRHVAGVGLLVLAFATLALLPWLPSRGAQPLDLPALAAVRGEVVLAFAGYDGCGTTCPLALRVMGNAYDGLPGGVRSRVALLFVNLRVGSRHALSTAYARAFHPQFQAHAVTRDDAGAFYRALGVSASSEGATLARHAGFVYLFARRGDDWRVMHVFRRAPGVDDLQEALHRTVHEAL